MSWKCNHVGEILFVLEDFTRKELETFIKPLTCISQLSKWNGPCDSSINPAPIDMNFFYSSAKTSSMKHGIANESVALTEYVP